MAHTLASRPSSPRCRDSFSSIDDDDEDDINEREEARAADDEEEGEAAMRWLTSRAARATRARQQHKNTKRKRKSLGTFVSASLS